MRCIACLGDARESPLEARSTRVADEGTLMKMRDNTMEFDGVITRINCNAETDDWRRGKRGKGDGSSCKLGVLQVSAESKTKEVSVHLNRSVILIQVRLIIINV